LLKRRIAGQGVKCDVVSVLADDSAVINIPTSEPFASLSELVLCVIPQDPLLSASPRAFWSFCLNRDYDQTHAYRSINQRTPRGLARDFRFFIVIMIPGPE